MRKDRYISEHLAAVRCAQEGATIATTPGKMIKGELSMVHDAWKRENNEFIKTISDDLRTLANAIEETGDVSYAMACVMCSGLLVDRITKSYLISASGLEDVNTYKRGREGIKVYTKSGELVDTIPYSRFYA